MTLFSKIGFVYCPISEVYLLSINFKQSSHLIIYEHSSGKNNFLDHAEITDLFIPFYYSFSWSIVKTIICESLLAVTKSQLKYSEVILSYEK